MSLFYCERAYYELRRFMADRNVTNKFIQISLGENIFEYDFFFFFFLPVNT